ncbi:MAG: tRNA (N6-threonylcarbamoyladenosine(37)-N6)-methyltransferase TrmO [Chromatiales bacterium]|jgi:tRNA-Thr(GGU) m(6)t(6)A37 methyltransferase TsaA
MRPIGRIRSPFKQKFGIPRQPGLAPAASATLELLPPYDRDEALRGLDGYSHVWLIFVFHETADEGWRPTVRPPRLGGNTRVGVFATRSPYRPNPIGMSLVELRGMARRAGTLCLDLGPIDLLDGTPVLDIKPHLPYADCPTGARAGFAEQEPEPRLEVEWSPEAATALAELSAEYPQLRELIEQMLALDPRPAYADEDPARVYGMRVYELDVRWRAERTGLIVTDIRDLR